MRYNKCKVCEYGDCVYFLGCSECTADTGYKSFKPKDIPNKESRWSLNLENLRAGALGDPEEPETLLRYWKAQEAIDYPYASENVQYFTELVANHKAAQPRDYEARWKGAGMGDYYCSLCQHTISERTKFCPECGAKMDEWEDVDI